MGGQLVLEVLGRKSVTAPFGRKGLVDRKKVITGADGWGDVRDYRLMASVTALGG